MDRKSTRVDLIDPLSLRVELQNLIGALSRLSLPVKRKAAAKNVYFPFVINASVLLSTLNGQL